MSPTIAGLIGIGVLVILLLSRMPVGFVMAVVGFLGFSYLVSIPAAGSKVALDLFWTFASYDFFVVPLFIFMGALAFNSGMSERLYYTAHRWLGHLPGGLAMATIGGCGGFAAICGSSPATAATMGTVALPEMKKYNYDLRLATGSIAAGGTLGILIPPSIVLIMYGILTEQSIIKLFYAGFIPGVLEVIIYISIIYILCRRNPHLGPRGPMVTFKEKIKSLTRVGEALVLFALVMGGLYMGWFTPTEAGGIGAGGALLIGLARRKLGRKGFINSVLETAQTSGMAIVVLVGTIIFGHFLAVTRIAFTLAEWIKGLPLPPIAILAIIALGYIIGGCLMDAFALVILTIPIYFPVAMALEFDPIWFGIIVVRVCEMGAITPPVGINVYILKGVAKDVPMFTIFRGIVPFLVGDIFLLAILIAFPRISLFLPNLIR